MKPAKARAAQKRFEEAVIDRLYARNAERAKEEALLGAGTKPTKAAKVKAPGTPEGDAARPRSSTALSAAAASEQVALTACRVRFTNHEGGYAFVNPFTEGT
jgi:hypothetical protein